MTQDKKKKNKKPTKRPEKSPEAFGFNNAKYSNFSIMLGPFLPSFNGDFRINFCLSNIFHPTLDGEEIWRFYLGLKRNCLSFTKVKVY